MVIAPNAPMHSPPQGPKPKARYIMIGGFLGAGKTTAASRLGDFLQKRGLKVGVITNGQGKPLVDTTTMRSRGFTTEEIQGGCFCSKFESFTEAARRLGETIEPDVVIGEPLGSCTDLVAAVSSPLQRMFGHKFALAPFSVMVDPIRAARVYGLESGAKFSDQISYIYRKQIEEAEIIVVNKSDLVPAQRLAKLKQTLEQHAVDATVFTVSARTGAGLEDWFDSLMRKSHSERNAMQMDYNVYAEAEALLAWLNCTVRVSSVKYFDSSKFLRELAGCIQSLLQQEGGEIAHLKMTLNPDEELGAVAIINLVRNDYLPEFSQELPEPIQSGELLLNMRAEADPEVLHSVVTRALLALMEKSPTLFARMEHCEHFRPGKPQPTHRIVAAV
jgi:G3E family GTPase